MEGQTDDINGGTAPPPKKKKKGLIIAVVAVVVAAAVILAAFFVILPALNPGVEGVWHITKIELNGNSTSMDGYLAFYHNGTLISLDNKTGTEQVDHWKYESKGEIELYEGSVGIIYKYAITGNNIKLSTSMKNMTLVMYGTKVSKLPPVYPRLSSWNVYIDGSPGDIITATPQVNGTATWNGTVSITVLDQNNKPLSGVKVSLSGCGVNVSGITDSSGKVTFHLNNVYLPNGENIGHIDIVFSYKGKSDTDFIEVVSNSTL